MTQKIIGLTGYKTSGKSTLANMLIQNRGFARCAFATPLKGMLISLLVDQGLRLKDAQRMVDGDLKEVASRYFAGQTPRHAMQTLGTEWGRQLIHPDFWIIAWKNRIEDIQRVVADDLRFVNEELAVHAKGGIIVRVNRPGLEAPADSHASESEVDSIRHNYLIENDGTPSDMWTQMETILATEWPKQLGQSVA